MPLREACTFHGTRLALLLTSHVLVGMAPWVKSLTTQDFAFGTDQVIAMISEIAVACHSGRLLGMHSTAPHAFKYFVSCPTL